MQDTFRRDIWISLGVIAGTVVVASAALALVAWHMNGIVTAIAAGRSAEADQDLALEDLVNLKQNAAAAAAYQAAMDQLLASQDALITFPDQVDALGRADGVSTSFSFQGNPTAATAFAPGTNLFTLSASGPAAAVLAFMKDFESSAPILLSSLNTFTVTAAGSEYTLSAQGTVYFQ